MASPTPPVQSDRGEVQYGTVRALYLMATPDRQHHELPGFCEENSPPAALTRPSPLCDARAAFDNANALTYSEINILLKKYVENKRLLDSNFQPNPMMKLAQEYAERFATTTNSDVAQQIRK